MTEAERHDEPLTARQQQIADLVVAGLTNPEIALRLGISTGDRSVARDADADPARADLADPAGGTNGEGTVTVTCEDCGAPLTTTAKYCSGACRQRAYRRRARDVVPASPRLDTFVGRAAELAELTKLLARNRIVTVTGPPGVGKSRLVHEAIAHRQHVMMIELADVSQGPGPARDRLRNPACWCWTAASTCWPDCAALVAGTPRYASWPRVASR